jgi:putative DNA primase/helicase
MTRDPNDMTPEEIRERVAAGRTYEPPAKGNGADTDGNRPVIMVRGGLLSDNAEEAERALRLANVEIYRQGGILVRPVRVPLRDSKRNEVQAVAIALVTAAMLRDECCRHADWEKWDGRSKKWIQIDPPKDVVETILSRKGDGSHWPTLAGVTGTPFLRSDGSIASKPGFDDMTGMFLMDPVALPSDMPARPTERDASRALALLEELLQDFPCVDPKDDEDPSPPHPMTTASHSVALSALLTPLARAAVSFVPAHVARAYVAGSGKSYLFDLSSAITNGTACPVLAAGKNAEETEKRISSFILAGVQIISIDNVNGVLSGDLINQIITAATVCPRILGKTETPPVTNVFTLFANGNNIRVEGDLTRRTLFCVLDAGLDAAEVQSRKFTSNPLAMVLADRGKYIAAALTIMRAHHLAGYPGAKDLSAFVGFDDWSRVVRGALVWLGKADPVSTLDVGRADDPQRNERQAFVEALGSTMARSETTAITLAEMEKLPDYPDLKEALSRFISPNGVFNKVKAGHWLAKFRNEPFEGKRLKSAPAGKGKLKWYVSGDDPPTTPTPTPTRCDDDGCSDFDAMEDSHG